MKHFETFFLDSCYGNELAIFLKKIHEDNYSWRIIEIDYIPFGDLNDISIKEKEDKINYGENYYYDISIEEMANFLQKIFK